MRGTCALVLLAVAPPASAAPSVVHARELVDGLTHDPAVLFKARQELEAVLAQDPRSVLALVQLARIERKLADVGEVVDPERLESAQALLDRAFAIRAESAEAWTESGYLALARDQEATAARRAAKRALAIRPGYPPAALLEVRCDAHDQDWERVDRLLISDLLDSKDPFTRRQALELLQERHASGPDTLVREHDFLELIRSYPKNGCLEHDYACWLIAQGRTRDAIAHARRAVSLEDVAEHRRTLARAYATVGTRLLQAEPDRARELLDQAIPLDPTEPEYCGTLARTYIDSKEMPPRARAIRLRDCLAGTGLGEGLPYVMFYTRLLKVASAPSP